jgi:hypothetical protein
MDDIEALRKRVEVLEDANAKLEKQWDCLHTSLLEAWRAIYLVSAIQSLQDSEEISTVESYADANIITLERFVDTV